MPLDTRESRSNPPSGRLLRAIRRLEQIESGADWPEVAAPMVEATEAPPAVEPQAAAEPATDSAPSLTLVPARPEFALLASELIASWPATRVVLAGVVPTAIASGRWTMHELARALARAAAGRVLLVEGCADVTSRCRAAMSLQQGWSDLLAGDGSFSDAVQPTADPQLDSLSPGHSFDPSSLDPRQFARILTQARRRYAFTLIDAGPSGDAATGGWLAGCDAVLGLFTLGQTTRREASELARWVAQSGARLHGSIVVRPAG
jgi:hypothetical protein